MILFFVPAPRKKGTRRLKEQEKPTTRIGVINVFPLSISSETAIQLVFLLAYNRQQGCEVI